MLIIEYVEKNNEFKLTFPTNRIFWKFIAKNVPATERAWNEEKNTWQIGTRYLTKVVKFGRTCFAHIDYSGIPTRYEKALDKLLAERSEVTGVQIFSEEQALYAQLHILPSAPDSLVKVAYKCLAGEYHPDKGGNAEKFIELNDAYTHILEIREDG